MFVNLKTWEEAGVWVNPALVEYIEPIGPDAELRFPGGRLTVHMSPGEVVEAFEHAQASSK